MSNVSDHDVSDSFVSYSIIAAQIAASERIRQIHRRHKLHLTQQWVCVFEAGGCFQ